MGNPKESFRFPLIFFFFYSDAENGCQRYWPSNVSTAKTTRERALGPEDGVCVTNGIVSERRGIGKTRGCIRKSNTWRHLTAAAAGFLVVAGEQSHLLSSGEWTTSPAGSWGFVGVD